MEVRTGYKQTEVGVIPEDWSVKTLGDVGDVRMCKRVFNHETSASGTIPFYKIGTFGKEPDAFITQILYDTYRQKFSFPQKGDILISAAGTIGRTIVYDGKPAYFQDSNIVWLENKQALINNEFLYHILKVVKYNTEGGTIQRLYNNILLSTKFICPTPKEQTVIATALSDADALISSLEKLIAKKRNIKQGAMQQLLQPKDGWEVKKLGEYIKFQAGYPFSSNYFNKKEKGLRLIKNRDLKSDDSIIFYDGQYQNEYIVKDGDVLIGMDGDFIPCLWNKGTGLLNQRIGRLVSIKQISIHFLYYYLQKHLKEIESITSSTTVKHLSHSDVEEIETYLPDYNEQVNICAALSDIDEEISALEAKLEKSKQIKQGMMQQLLTGKIRLV